LGNSVQKGKFSAHSTAATAKVPGSLSYDGGAILLDDSFEWMAGEDQGDGNTDDEEHGDQEVVPSPPATLYPCNISKYDDSNLLEEEFSREYEKFLRDYESNTQNVNWSQGE